MDAVKIMDTVRDALNKTEMSQADIAKAVGIHRVNVSQFKSGQRDLPLKALCKLADAIGLEITVKKRRA